MVTHCTGCVLHKRVEAVQRGLPQTSVLCSQRLQQQWKQLREREGEGGREREGEGGREREREGESSLRPMPS